jgi:hypothetical protein
MIADLKTLVEGYVKPNRNRGVKRNKDSYAQCLAFVEDELARSVATYRTTVFAEDMRARLIRDSIDRLIRRFHDYSIKERIGSHYREVGVAETESVFEHVIPASSIRDMLIGERLTIKQALNAPTCLIKKSQDEILTKNGLVKSSPNNYIFFKRYQILNSTFTTNDGTAIDPVTWTLEQHFDYFKHLVL